MSEVKTNKITSLASNNDITLAPDGTGAIKIGDSTELVFGDGSDFKISHNGSKTKLEDTGTGNLEIRGTNIEFYSGDGGETLAKLTDDGAAELYHNNTKRIETTSTGATITGDATFTDSDATTIIDRVGTNVAGIKTGAGDDFCVGTADYPQAIRIKNATSRVGIGNTAPSTQLHVEKGSGADIVTIKTDRTDSTNVGMIIFEDGDSSTCGKITSQGSSNTTSYNTSSDHRLKQSVTGMTGAIDRVKALLPKRFSFVNDTTNTMHDGFLTHEAQTVVPQSVIGTHNETREVSNAVLLASGKLYAEDVTQEDWTANKGDDENDLYPSDSTWAASHTAPVYQQIDHSKIVPLLVGALKESIAKIETLETKVAALEAGE